MRGESLLSTSDYLIHIELEATVTIKDDAQLPCSITLNLGEQNSINQVNTTSHDNTQAPQEIKCNEKLKSETMQKNKQDTGVDHGAEGIKELFGFPDEEPEDRQNTNNLNTDMRHKIVSIQSASTTSKDKLSGGGSKPISSKQKNLIQKMANEQNKNVDEVINAMFHKSINQLEGHEADSVIKSMRKTRR